MGIHLHSSKLCLPLSVVRKLALSGFVWVLLTASGDPAQLANQLCDQADRAAGSGNYDQAIVLYNKAIQTDDKLARAYLNRGIALDQINRCKEALSDFDKALSLSSSNDKFRQEFYYNRGMCLHRLGRYKDAISDYDEALRLYKDASYNFMRGRSLRALSRLGDALKDFDIAVAHTQGDERASSLFHRGLTYRDMGKNDKALFDFSNAIAAFEQGYDEGDEMQLKGSKHNLPAAYFERGKLYKKLGKNELASSDLKRAEGFHYRPDNEHRLPVKITR